LTNNNQLNHIPREELEFFAQDPTDNSKINRNNIKFRMLITVMLD